VHAQNFRCGVSPPRRRGTLRPKNKCHVTLEQGAAGEVRKGLCFDHPRHAEAKVALHLLDRRGDPSFKGGEMTLPQLVPTFGWATRPNGRDLHPLARHRLEE
jgi:hypothetical protein